MVTYHLSFTKSMIPKYKMVLCYTFYGLGAKTQHKIDFQHSAFLLRCTNFHCWSMHWKFVLRIFKTLKTGWAMHFTFVMLTTWGIKMGARSGPEAENLLRMASDDKTFSWYHILHPCRYQTEITGRISLEKNHGFKLQFASFTILSEHDKKLNVQCRLPNVL
jgi:hypothetical protein